MKELKLISKIIVHPKKRKKIGWGVLNSFIRSRQKWFTLDDRVNWCRRFIGKIIFP
jgi:hypothetical protein